MLSDALYLWQIQSYYPQNAHVVISYNNDEIGNWFSLSFSLSIANVLCCCVVGSNKRLIVNIIHIFTRTNEPVTDLVSGITQTHTQPSYIPSFFFPGVFCLERPALEGPIWPCDDYALQYAQA